MVFQSMVQYARARGPDEFWRKRKIFRLAGHFRGRFRNCYSNAIRAVHRSLQFATKGRKPRREWISSIWRNRVEAGCVEHNARLEPVKAGLTRCDIHLDHKNLADLAIWEPRTFKCLVKIGCARLKQDGIKILLDENNLKGIVTKGLIK